MTERHVIDTRSEYSRALNELRSGTGPVAIDTERASGYRYSNRAYLVQLFRRESGVFLLDAPALGSLDDIGALLEQEEWILHAASQDLPCLREIGIDPHHVFDTELAARLLGFTRVGLGPVVEETLGIHLAKEHSAADWSTRPLPQSWLEYAAYDVEYLVDVRDELDHRLHDQRKWRIAQEEFTAVVEAEPKPPKAEPWRKLAGGRTARGARGLAVARELWNARDALARATDTAPGRLVPDRAFKAVVKAMPRSKEALAGLREFTGRASRSELDRWWGAIERGRDTEDVPSTAPADGEHLPPPRVWGERNPEADARLKRAKTAVERVADVLGMPVENVLKPSLLRRVSWDPPTPVNAAEIGRVLVEFGARPWQAEATGPLIDRAFVEAAQFGAPEAETTS